MEIDAATFVVLDTETTGFDSAGEDRICEVGAIMLRNGREIGRFHSLVNPGRPIPAAASKTNGITDPMVEKSPAFRDIAPGLRSFLAGIVLVGQNVEFDLGFLNAEFLRAGMSPLQVPAIDTIALARRVRPGLSSYKLDNLAFQFRVPFRARHRSIGDAEVTAAIFLQCAGHLRHTGECRTLEDLVRRGARGDSTRLPRANAADAQSPTLL